MVLLKTLVTGALLATSAMASAKCRPTGPAKQIKATFDDLKYSDDVIPIGKYKDLEYTGFYVDRYDGFIKPPSGTQWAMSFDPAGAHPTIKTLGEGDTFNLKSFSFACMAGYPQAECKVRVRGEKANGISWTANVITYPALDNTKPFVFSSYQFDERYWSDLTTVEFEYARLADGKEAGLGIDDVVYEKRGCK